MKLLLVLVGFFFSYSICASPFADADLKAGKKLHQYHCISCHASSYGGDGTAIYTHEYRKIRTTKGLLAQVRNCNTNIGLKWFEDEELNVAGYLNQNYYQLGD
jgi:hypothetical protein